MTQDRHNQGVRVGTPRYNAYERQDCPPAVLVAQKRDGGSFPTLPSRVVALDKALWPILWIGLGFVAAWLTFKVMIVNAADLTATRTPITHSTNFLPLLIGGLIALGMLTGAIVVWYRKRGQGVALARKATSLGMAILAFLALVGSVLVTSGVASATTSVTLYATPSGTGSNGCTSVSDDCSLVEAILTAEIDSGDAVTIYLIHSEGYYCTTGDPCTFGGDQTISSSTNAASITIEPDGAPNATATLDGDNSASNPGTVFTNDAPQSVSVSLEYLTITGGYTANGAAGVYNADSNGGSGGNGNPGGGIYNNDGDMTITNCTISGNETGAGGNGAEGGVIPVTVFNQPETNGGAGGAAGHGGNGAGIYNNGGVMYVLDSTISDNETGVGGNGGNGGSGDHDGGVGGNGGAGGSGGGIYNNKGIMGIRNSTISNNELGSGNNGGNGGLGGVDGFGGQGGWGGNGGGVANFHGFVVITNSTISYNTIGTAASGGDGGKGGDGYGSVGGAGGLGGFGGGVYNSSYITVPSEPVNMIIINSTISNNTTGNGGNGGTGGSSALGNGNGGTGGNGGYGGGVSNLATNAFISIVDSTIANNDTGTGGIGGAGGTGGHGNSGNTGANGTSGAGGGIDNLGTNSQITGSIVAYNTANSGNENCSGSIQDNGYNISNGSSCDFTATGSVDYATLLYLGSLTNNGGSTETIALLSDSTGINAIPTTATATVYNGIGSTDTQTIDLCGASSDPSENTLLGTNLAISQNGAPRNDGQYCDAGAWEAPSAPFAQRSSTTTTVTCTPSTSAYGTTVNCTTTVTNGTTTPPSGTVIITTSTGQSCTVTLSGGTGSCSLTDIPPGTASVTASYQGNQDNEKSSGTTSLTVTEDTTSTNIIASPSSGTPGTSTTLTVVVFNISLQQPATGGTVTITGGNTTICSVPLESNGTVQCTTSLPTGSENLVATYSGTATEYPSSDSTTISGAQPTTTTVTCSPQSSVYGTPVDCTATVANGTTTPPSGTVTITTSTSQSCTATLSGGTGSCSLTDIPPGTISVTASYSGDQNNGASSGTTSLTITKDTTSTSISASPSSGVAGTTSTLTVTVVNTSLQEPATGGTVTVTTGSTTICTASLGSKGTAQCTTPLPVGSEELEASYSGTSTELSSSGTTTISGKQTTTTTVTCSPQSSAYGTTVNCTATVTNNLTTPASGTVSITTSSGQSCTATLSDATGSCSLTDIPPGTISVTASYSGDQDNEPSSGTTSLTITKDTTSTSITASPSSGVAGTTSTLTVTVVNSSLQEPATGGTVTITTGSTTICTASLGTKGTAQCTTPLPVGSEELEASYSGTSTELSSSGTTTISGKQTTTTTVTCSPQSSAYGTTVNCTATVANNLTTPASGTVSITTSSGQSCTATLSDATGSCSLTDIPPGTISVTANYSGDQDNEPSSGTTSLTITKDTTSTSISASPSSGVAGTTSTLTISVVNTSLQQPATGGTVTITTGSTTICTASLGSKGTAQCTTPLPVGSEELEASYSGTSTELSSSGTTTISGKQMTIFPTCTGTGCNSTPPPTCTGTGCNSTPPSISSCHGNDCHLTHSQISLIPSGKHHLTRVPSKCRDHKPCVVPTRTIVTCNPTLERTSDLRYVVCTVTVKADYGLDVPGGTLSVTHYGMHKDFIIRHHLIFVLSGWKPPTRAGRYLVLASYSGYQIDGIDYLPSVGSIKIVLGTLVCLLPTAYDTGWKWFGSSLPWWLLLAALILGTLWVISYRRYNPQELAESLIREETFKGDDEDDDDEKGSE
jgi:hypothetical protein